MLPHAFQGRSSGADDTLLQLCAKVMSIAKLSHIATKEIKRNLGAGDE